MYTAQHVDHLSCTEHTGVKMHISITGFVIRVSKEIAPLITGLPIVYCAVVMKTTQVGHLQVTDHVSLDQCYYFDQLTHATTGFLYIDLSVVHVSYSSLPRSIISKNTTLRLLNLYFYCYIHMGVLNPWGSYSAYEFRGNHHFIFTYF